MTSTKFLIGQIVLVFTVVFIATWSATQWAAHMLGYQNMLVHDMLSDYVRIYEKTYGTKESAEELIPFIVAAFLEGDHAFRKERKQLSVTL